MQEINVCISGNVQLHLSCSKCHTELEVTHQADDIGENWLEVKPHICKE